MITINAIIQLFRACMDANWVAIVFMLLMVVLDTYAHRTNLKRLVENKENSADLQEGLQKDIEKIKNKRQRRLDRYAEKQEKIEVKYDKKITKKSEKVQKRIDKLNDRERPVKEGGVDTGDALEIESVKEQNIEEKQDSKDAE
jgi:hypothetical protein